MKRRKLIPVLALALAAALTLSGCGLWHTPKLSDEAKDAIKDAVQAGIVGAEVPMYLVGVAVAAVTGYLCIRLLKYIADKGRFGAFAYYCWAAGVLTLVLQGIK